MTALFPGLELILEFSPDRSQGHFGGVRYWNITVLSFPSCFEHIGDQLGHMCTYQSAVKVVLEYYSGARTIPFSSHVNEALPAYLLDMGIQAPSA